MCDFKPGDEVVCIDAGPGRGGADTCIPMIREGATYVVREMRDRLHPDAHAAGVHAVVRLHGVTVPLPGGAEGWFDAARFRKRDLAAWLQTADGREPAPRCPKVLAVLRGVAG